MSFIETLLWPLRWLVELVLVAWHSLFTAMGLDPASGAAWVLAILGLVVVVRSALIPITVKQIKSQRKMMEVAPEVKKIQQKYKGKTDQFSREAMSRETMALYKKHGTSPFASCLPMLLQMPIFFSLFYVLRNASGAMGSGSGDGAPQAGVGLLTMDLTESFNQAEIWGAPVKMTFTQAWNDGPFQVMVFLGIIMVLMIASQFFTQKQIMSKNISDETKASPMYKQQQILLYIIPFAFLFSGLVFPLALNIYWFSSNLWTMAQQTVVIRNMPTPGTEAYRMRQERLRKKGKLTDEELQVIEAEEARQEQAGQRQQPMSAKRAKKKKK